MVTLILPNGKIMVFHIPKLAEQYQQAYGGTIVTGGILDRTVMSLVDDQVEIGYNPSILNEKDTI
jgi:hypothetical protein